MRTVTFGIAVACVAALAVAAIAAPVQVEWIGEDTTTGGDWLNPAGSPVGTYGSCAYILPDPPAEELEVARGAFSAPVGFDIGDPLTYGLLGDSPYNWTSTQMAGLGYYEPDSPYGDEFWSALVDFSFTVAGTEICVPSRVLADPVDSSLRKAATYFGSNVVVAASMPAGTYAVSLYMLDFDSNARVQVGMLSAAGGADAVQVQGFNDGVYLTFFVHLPQADVLAIDISQVAGANAVLAGVFVDATALTPADAQIAEIGFVEADWDTQGGWVGSYGGLGYVLAGWNAPPSTALAWDASLDAAGGVLDGNYSVDGTVFAWSDFQSYTECVQYPVFEWAWEEYQELPSDPRAVYFPSQDKWRLTVWDDGGERGTPVNGYIDFNLFFPEGQYLLSLYTYDYETNQRESVEFVLYDENGAELASRQVSGDALDGGAYEQFVVDVPAGGGSLIVQVVNDAGYPASLNTLLAGIFVDCLGGGGGDPASLGDRVWYDANTNGVQDSGEGGIPAVTVNLYSATNGVVGTQLTDTNGNYLFTDLEPGDYYVEFVKPAGFDFSPQNASGNPETDSDADPNSGLTVTITLESGEQDLSWDAGLYEPELDCGPCDGKVTQLTLLYLGDSAATIKVFQKIGLWKAVPVFSGLVQPGGVFTFSGKDRHGTLGPEISIYVMGVWGVTKIHTSCSQPIGPGLVKGDFEVLEGYSRNGGMLCPVEDEPPSSECDCEGKVVQLTLKYLGVSPAQVDVLQKDGVSVFSGVVGAGQQFSIVGQDKLGTLGTEIYLHVDGAEPPVNIHTSCSQPIGPGLVKGDFEVVDGYSRSGGQLCPLEYESSAAEAGDGSAAALYPLLTLLLAGR